MADGSFQIEGRKVQRAYRLRCCPSRQQRQLLARHLGAVYRRHGCRQGAARCGGRVPAAPRWLAMCR